MNAGDLIPMTPYLEGLKNLFDKYGVKVAYSIDPFRGIKEEGVSILVEDSVPQEGIMEIYDYVDPFMGTDVSPLPEQISACAGIRSSWLRDKNVIYHDGNFYYGGE